MILFYKEYADSPETSGLDEERRRYLQREIREYCQPGTEDFVAPVVT